MKMLTTMARRGLQGTLLILATLLSQPLLAEQFVAVGDYEIHYNAFNSTFVEPDVAKNAGIQRSKVRALVNVSVLKKEGDKKTPVTAMVSGKATNLISQTQDIGFSKLDEGEAIYYLGQFGFSDDMVMRIALDVQPDANAAPYHIEFEQRFFAE
ncbi:DUF4426 domain-containing protein [Neptuniibacter sp. CAU 1671]|uniref:DUF4426 domain-containing protein n=1 Tax=Neptuniibacter sp. CAU 1671 TaxID=3032593 RepID=UPI0023DA574B|nr:DUF4426 domain-containing protein [Neptuniibacter sp. CAU 1671]MDF2182393.1 DUF4426 domain-containing protein [Neptuniibacter sp. CAU 1671]